MTMSPPTAPPDLDVLTDWAARFVNAMLDSRGEIGTDFWTRARTALEASAACATFPDMVSKAAAKLECHGALAAETVRAVGALSGALADPGTFGAFAEFCEHDAVFVTAVARIARDERKQAAKAAKAAKAADSEMTGESRF